MSLKNKSTAELKNTYNNKFARYNGTTQHKGERINNPIVEAHRIISREIRRREMAVECSISEDNCWVRIELVNEGRDVWVGYKDGKGYFLSWRRALEKGPFFALDDSGISQILALVPKTTTDNGEAERDRERVTDLLESLKSPQPDPIRLERILDEIPSTIEGLDIFATVACLKSYRLTVNRLRDMVATQAEMLHDESEYQTLIRNHPWMLGSQYCQVLGEESTIWFHSRVDLLLGSAMGHIDIVELKRPDTDLLVQGTRPKTWRKSCHLSDACAQARKYLQRIDEHRHDIVRELGLPRQSVPRLYRSSVILVLGRTPENDDALEALRDLNSENARIVIMTYDDVVAVAEATIAIFEKRLTGSPLNKIGASANSEQDVQADV